MPIRRDLIEHLGGALDVYRKTADSGRQADMHSCARCHTLLWNAPLSAPDLLIVKPGTLDDAGWAEPAGNIWVEQRLPWIKADPGALDIEGQPADREPLYAAWRQRQQGSIMLRDFK